MLKETLIGAGGVIIGVSGTYLAQNFISNSDDDKDSNKESKNSNDTKEKDNS